MQNTNFSKEFSNVVVADFKAASKARFEKQKQSSIHFNKSIGSIVEKLENRKLKENNYGWSEVEESEANLRCHPLSKSQLPIPSTCIYQPLQSDLMWQEPTGKTRQPMGDYSTLQSDFDWSEYGNAIQGFEEIKNSNC